MLGVGFDELFPIHWREAEYVTNPCHLTYSKLAIAAKQARGKAWGFPLEALRGGVSAICGYSSASSRGNQIRRPHHEFLPQTNDFLCRGDGPANSVVNRRLGQDNADR